MRFALYADDEHGDESVGLSVARSAAVLPRHELTRVVGRPQRGPGLPPFASTVRYCRSWEDLPVNCRAYVERLEELCGAPIEMIGVGPRRDQFVVRGRPYFERA